MPTKHEVWQRMSNPAAEKLYPDFSMAADPFDRWGQRWGDYRPPLSALHRIEKDSMSMAGKTPRGMGGLPNTSMMSPFQISLGETRRKRAKQEPGLPELAIKTKFPSREEVIADKISNKWGLKGGQRVRPMPTYGGENRRDNTYLVYEDQEKRRQGKIRNRRAHMDHYVHFNKGAFKNYLVKNKGEYSQAVRDYLARYPGTIDELFNDGPVVHTAATDRADPISRRIPPMAPKYVGDPAHEWDWARSRGGRG